LEVIGEAVKNTPLNFEENALKPLGKIWLA
jgi:uncharacterized protein with HEPN domain